MRVGNRLRNGQDLFAWVLQAAHDVHADRAALGQQHPEGGLDAVFGLAGR